MANKTPEELAIRLYNIVKLKQTTRDARRVSDSLRINTLIPRAVADRAQALYEDLNELVLPGE